jgi:RNA polymerase sigma-70 factor (ECF subfamily)
MDWGVADMWRSVGDRERFERMYRDHADRVHAYAWRRSDAATADEVVAEVFLVAWRRLDRVPGEPLPWLLAVSRRVLANRRRSIRRAAALQGRLQQAFRSPVSGVVDHTVLGALAMLGERDRELLLLIAWDGLSQAEAAEVLGIRRPAVATRLHRARQRLADALAAQNDSALGEMEVRR